MNNIYYRALKSNNKRQQQAKKNINRVNEHVECVICLNNFNNTETGENQVVYLDTPKCMHKFHKKCIDNYINTSNVKRCPICRRKFNRYFRVIKDVDAPPNYKFPDEQPSEEPHAFSVYRNRNTRHTEPREPTAFRFDRNRNSRHTEPREPTAFRFDRNRNPRHTEPREPIGFRFENNRNNHQHFNYERLYTTHPNGSGSFWGEGGKNKHKTKKRKTKKHRRTNKKR